MSVEIPRRVWTKRSTSHLVSASCTLAAARHGQQSSTAWRAAAAQTELDANTPAPSSSAPSPDPFGSPVTGNRVDSSLRVQARVEMCPFFSFAPPTALQLVRLTAAPKPEALIVPKKSKLLLPSAPQRAFLSHAERGGAKTVYWGFKSSSCITWSRKNLVQYMWEDESSAVVYQTQRENNEKQVSRRSFRPTNKNFEMKIHRSRMSNWKNFKLQATGTVLVTITGNNNWQSRGFMCDGGNNRRWDTHCSWLSRL